MNAGSLQRHHLALGLDFHFRSKPNIQRIQNLDLPQVPGSLELVHVKPAGQFALREPLCDAR
jgi:hypothetical protein